MCAPFAEHSDLSSPSPRTAVLHIGVIKTGSTSIQRYLQGVRHLLPPNGFHYPGAIGAESHAALAMAIRDALDPASREAAAQLDRLLAALAAELAELPAGVGTVLISSEHFSGLPDDGVALLRDRLAPLFASFRILVYLRRQDDFALSRYANMIRSGRQVSSPFEIVPPNYDTLLRRWVRVFGEAALMPRIFDAAEMPGGNVVPDALAALGIRGVPPPPAERVNPNLQPEAIELLRRFNDLAEREALPETEKLRNRLAALLQAGAAGRGELPARAEAAAYVAAHAAPNEAVRARWFPSRASLFSDDFSHYPETAAPSPDAAATLDLALRLLARQLG